MQNEIFETKRTPEGAIDIQHHARLAHAERRAAKNKAMRNLGRGTKRVTLAVLGFVMFWNIPPMGSSGSKDMPYR